jgi:uncharacterized protein
MNFPAVNLFFKSFIFFISILLSGSMLLAQDIPQKPNRLVNDYTHTLSPEQVSRLEQKLVAFDDSTSTQIAVVVMRSTGSYDVADYATRLGQKWGVGQDKKNNGIVLLAALEDKKVTIQTGYGVEGALPDAITARIIRNEIVPEFKSGNYYEGLDRATDAIISYTKGEYKNEEAQAQQGRRRSHFPSGLLLPIIIIVVVLISKIGGGGGGGGRIIGSRGSASPFWWLLMGSALSRGGRGGDSWGGGSSAGGGFGGFGGGSFGGGGSSGSW